MCSHSTFIQLIFGALLISWSSSSQPLSITDSDQFSITRLRRSGSAEDGLKTSDDSTTPERLCAEGSAFHNDTNCCHKLLEQGPCGELQLFYQVAEGSNYGTCGCMANPDGCSKLVQNNRMVLPDPDSKQCYLAFSQGPCQTNEWFILNLKSLQPECQKNPCFSAEPKKDSKSCLADTTTLKKATVETDVFEFTMKDQCYKTFTRGPCPEGQYVQFLGTLNPYPKCFRSGPPMCLFSIGTSAGLPCEAGHKLVGDDCVPITEFE